MIVWQTVYRADKRNPYLMDKPRHLLRWSLAVWDEYTGSYWRI
jgi:hypothetical protein